MAKPKLKQDAILKAVYNMLGKGQAQRLLMGELANRPVVEQEIAKLVRDHAARVGGKLNVNTATELMRQGGGLALPGAGVGAVTGFLTAPGQEEENLLGMKKYRGPSMADRLQYALMLGAGGAAAGAGLGAYNQRQLAQQLVANKRLDPSVIQSYLRTANLVPQVEKTITTQAARAGKGAGGAAAATANAALRSPQEMSNSLQLMYHSIMNRAQTHGFKDANVLSGMNMLSNLTGQPPQVLVNNSSAAIAAIEQASLAHYGKLDNKALGAIANMAGIIGSGRLVGDVSAASPTLLDRIHRVFNPYAAATGGVVNIAKNRLGMGTPDVDRFMRDLTRGNKGSDSLLRSIDMPSLTKEQRSEYAKSLGVYSELFNPKKGQPVIPSYNASKGLYSDMMTDRVRENASNTLRRAGAGAAVLGLGGATALGVGASLGQNTAPDRGAVSEQPQQPQQPQPSIDSQYGPRAVEILKARGVLNARRQPQQPQPYLQPPINNQYPFGWK